METRTNEPMARHTSFRVGGPADRFVIPLPIMYQGCPDFLQSRTASRSSVSDSGITNRSVRDVIWQLS